MLRLNAETNSTVPVSGAMLSQILLRALIFLWLRACQCAIWNGARIRSNMPSFTRIAVRTESMACLQLPAGSRSHQRPRPTQWWATLRCYTMLVRCLGCAIFRSSSPLSSSTIVGAGFSRFWHSSKLRLQKSSNCFSQRHRTQSSKM